MAIEFIQPGERHRGNLNSACGDPVMISCWLFVDDTQDTESNFHRLCQVVKSDHTDNISISFAADGTGPRLRCQINGASGSLLTTTIMDTGTAIQGAWQHVLLYVEDAGAVRAWVDGINRLDTTTTATDFSNCDKWALGSRYTTQTNAVDGKTEGFTVWSDGTMWSSAQGLIIADFLSQGGSPWLIEPDKIINVVNGYYDTDQFFGQTTAIIGTPDLIPIANPIQNPR